MMTKVKKNHRKKSNQMQWENKQMGEIIIREGKKNKEQARSSGLSLWLCAIRHKHHSSRVVGRKPAMGEDNSIKALERLLPFCMPTSTQDGGEMLGEGPLLRAALTRYTEQQGRNEAMDTDWGRSHRDFQRSHCSNPRLIMVQVDEMIWFIRVWLKETDRKTKSSMSN